MIHSAPLSLPFWVRCSHCISWIMYLPYILLITPLSLHLVSPRISLHLACQKGQIMTLTWFLRILICGISRNLCFVIRLSLFVDAYNDLYRNVPQGCFMLFSHHFQECTALSVNLWKKTVQNFLQSRKFHSVLWHWLGCWALFLTHTAGGCWLSLELHTPTPIVRRALSLLYPWGDPRIDVGLSTVSSLDFV